MGPEGRRGGTGRCQQQRREKGARQHVKHGERIDRALALLRTPHGDALTHCRHCDAAKQRGHRVSRTIVG